MMNIENAFYVGGVVRDILMGCEPADIDIVVVGDGIAAANKYASDCGGEVREWPTYGTATVYGDDGQVIDFVTARKETYAGVGAMPVVMPGTLDDDLARRDFTINAMAMELNREAVIDPFGGEEDLYEGVIATLHGASFRDDPTRMFRAVRYMGRYGFSLDTMTEVVMRQSIGYGDLDQIAGYRIRRELDKIFQEDKAGAILGIAEDLGILSAVNLNGRDIENGQMPMDYVRRLCRDLNAEQREALIKRFDPPSRWKVAIREQADVV